MNVIMRRIDELKPYEMNAKEHPETQIVNVAESIRRFGWKQPIVIDAEDTIIIGHCRVEAAKRIGLKEAPCLIADDLTPMQVRELRILDNRLNESPWDYELLMDEIADLPLEGFNLDFSALTASTTGEAKDGSGEIDLEDFDDDQFDYICDECGFRFNA